jgi:hypothetical protein
MRLQIAILLERLIEGPEPVRLVLGHLLAGVAIVLDAQDARFLDGAVDGATMDANPGGLFATEGVDLLCKLLSDLILEMRLAELFEVDAASLLAEEDARAGLRG